jgi:hypothetical protein
MSIEPFSVLPSVIILLGDFETAQCVIKKFGGLKTRGEVYDRNRDFIGKEGRIGVLSLYGKVKVMDCGVEDHGWMLEHSVNSELVSCGNRYKINDSTTHLNFKSGSGVKLIEVNRVIENGASRPATSVNKNN